MDPCKQDENVKVLQIEQAVVGKALAGIEGTLRSNNKLLSQVAGFLSELNHLHEDQRRTEKSMDEMYKRVRSLELMPSIDGVVASLATTVETLNDKVTTLEAQPGKFASKAWWVTFGVLAGASGSVLSSLVVIFIRWGLKL